MKKFALANRINTALLISLLIIATPVAAITPCLPNPCEDEASTQSDKSTDWIAEGVITELRYGSFNKLAGLPYAPGMVEQYEARPFAIVFLPDKVVKGAPLPSESIIYFETCLHPVPSLEQMRPMRITVRVRKAGKNLILINFKNSARASADVQTVTSMSAIPLEVLQMPTDLDRVDR